MDKLSRAHGAEEIAFTRGFQQDVLGPARNDRFSRQITPKDCCPVFQMRQSLIHTLNRESSNDKRTGDRAQPVIDVPNQSTVENAAPVADLEPLRLRLIDNSEGQLFCQFI